MIFEIHASALTVKPISGIRATLLGLKVYAEFLHAYVDNLYIILIMFCCSVTI